MNVVFFVLVRILYGGLMEATAAEPNIDHLRGSSQHLSPGDSALLEPKPPSVPLLRSSFSWRRRLVLSENDKVYMEDSGLIVVEAESIFWKSDNTTTNNDTDENEPLWVIESNTPGFTGTGYARFNGNDVDKGPPAGRHSLYVDIAQPGVYRLALRSLHNHTERPDWSNDCYTRAVGFVGEAYENRHVKTFNGGSVNEWTYKTKHEPPAKFNLTKSLLPLYNFSAPGTYELQFSGRARHFRIDRIVLFDTAQVQKGYAFDLARPESRVRQPWINVTERTVAPTVGPTNIRAALHSNAPIVAASDLPSDAPTEAVTTTPTIVATPASPSQVPTSPLSVFVELSLALVDVSNGTTTDIGPLTDGYELVFGGTATQAPHLTIRAHASHPVDAVDFVWDGEWIRREMQVPFTLNGEHSNGQYKRYRPLTSRTAGGWHTLQAIATVQPWPSSTVILANHTVRLHIVWQDDGENNDTDTISPTMPTTVPSVAPSSQEKHDSASSRPSPLWSVSAVPSVVQKNNATVSPSRTLAPSVDPMATAVPSAVPSQQQTNDAESPSLTTGPPMETSALPTTSTPSGADNPPMSPSAGTSQQPSTLPKSSLLALTIVNADTDADIGPLLNSTIIHLGSIGTENLSVRVDATYILKGRVQFIEFVFDDVSVRTERVAPFALNGDVDGDYNGFRKLVKPGMHTLFVRAWFQGERVASHFVTFSVVSTNCEAPTLGPTPAPSLQPPFSTFSPNDQSSNVPSTEPSSVESTASDDVTQGPTLTPSSQQPFSTFSPHEPTSIVPSTEPSSVESTTSDDPTQVRTPTPSSQQPFSTFSPREPSFIFPSTLPSFLDDSLEPILIGSDNPFSFPSNIPSLFVLSDDLYLSPSEWPSSVPSTVPSEDVSLTPSMQTTEGSSLSDMPSMLPSNKESSFSPRAPPTATAAPQATTEQQFVNFVQINAGASDEDLTLISEPKPDGKKKSFVTEDAISGNGIVPIEYFQSQRYPRGNGKRLTYTIPGWNPFSNATVTVGFTEIYTPNCVTGARVLDVHVNGEPLVGNVDVFQAVGCHAAYTRTGQGQVGEDGIFVLEFTATVEKPMVSFIQISTP